MRNVAFSYPSTWHPLAEPPNGTAPIDYNFPPGAPADGLAISSDGQFLRAMGDGSVQLLPGDLRKETLLHLFQMNDGQAIKLP